MLIEAEVWTVARTDQGNAVLIRPRGGEVAVPIFIGQMEAQSILIGLGNVPMPRPLTHDLLLSVLDKFHSIINRVEITGLKGGTYYANLVVDSEGTEIPIDARPSDSLALAVRTQCPIYIADSVVDAAGISIDKITEQQSGFPNEDDITVQRDLLEQELNKAVEEENYEEAARIRDRIQELEEEE
ncbi:MAG: bifunctional nuclease domain-containing protein [Spirochaetia bacterium]